MLEYTNKYNEKMKETEKLNQQGTIQNDTSETIRINSLKMKYKKDFLNWFIGFVEGSENVFIVNRRYLRFEINASFKNQKIIYYIKNNLGFGKIRKLRFLGGILLELSVQNNIANLLRLIYIFNGNFRSENREKSFSIFYNKLRNKLKKLHLLHLLPEYIPSLKNISLMNSWLLGYIDSRMLFCGRWHKSKNLKKGKELYLNCVFWHLDLELLEKIKEALNLSNKIEIKTKWNLLFYKLEINVFNEKEIIVEYLSKFKLKSEKKKRYKCWKYLFDLEANIKAAPDFDDFEKIEKLLIQLNSTMEEGELNKV